MTQRRRVLSVFAILLPIAVAGCGGKDGLPSVRGTVTYNGKPLPNALVAFAPEAPGSFPASGLTDSNGRYELTTRVPGDGASLGKYRVAVTARGPEKERPPGAPGLTAGTTDPGDPLIPTKYFAFDTSGLTAEVKPGDNTADFDLK